MSGCNRIAENLEFGYTKVHLPCITLIPDDVLGHLERLPGLELRVSSLNKGSKTLGLEIFDEFLQGLMVGFRV